MREKKCRRIAEFAFDFAVAKGRKKVTAVHKANIMKMADGLFLKTCREVSKNYPGIEFNDMIVDNTCMQLVSNPWQFDVMVLPNLYGNVVGNVCCGIVGGPGITAGSNYNGSITAGTLESRALFEMATRNTGTSITGQNVANPCAFQMAGAKLLEYYQLWDHANIIRNAITHTLDVEKVHTPDLGGTASTMDVVHCINSYIKKELKDQTTFHQRSSSSLDL